MSESALKSPKIVTETHRYVVADLVQLNPLAHRDVVADLVLLVATINRFLRITYIHIIVNFMGKTFRSTTLGTFEKVVQYYDARVPRPRAGFVLVSPHPQLPPPPPVLAPPHPQLPPLINKVILNTRNEIKNASEAASPRDSPIAWPANVTTSTPTVPCSKPEEEKKSECIDGTPISKTLETPKTKIKGGGLVDYPSFNATHDSHSEDSESDSSNSQESTSSRSKITR
ncbi:unnamed protein product, partial [Meganyctiphanes norvegica]